jgi:exodeoxyribonuclease V alpha subunit
MLEVNLQKAVDAGVLTRESAQIATSCAQALGEANPEAILLAAMVVAWYEAGHTSLDIETFDPIELASLHEKVSAQIDWPDPARVCMIAAQSVLFGGGVAARPFVFEENRYLAMGRVFHAETRFVAAWKRRCGQADWDVCPDRLADALAQSFGEVWRKSGFQESQVLAVAIAVLRPLTLLTGGPGTGKTTTVARFLATLAQLSEHPLRVALAAPTGKAAARMVESIRAFVSQLPAELAAKIAIPSEAQTLHRLLGLNDPWLPQARFDRNDPLQVDLIVVDEASMIDLDLMTRLFEALPSSARLVLVGDPQQLPSVDAGSVLADLCRFLPVASDEHFAIAPESTLAASLERCASAGSVPKPSFLRSPVAPHFVTRVALTQARRYDETSGIGQLARVMMRDKVEAKEVLTSLRHADTGDLEWIELAHQDTPESVAWFRRIVSGYAAAFAGEHPAAWVHGGQSRFRVLSAMRRGDWGVESLNEVVARSLRKSRGFVAQPLMITQNDYEAQLFNGDLGVFAPAHNGRESGSRIAHFPGSQGGLRSFATARLPAYELAYALTVHKSQGSEFDEVWLVLDQTAANVANVELLFTAVTRAREKLVICAAAATLESVLSRRSNRQTGLVRRLREALGAR